MALASFLPPWPLLTRFQQGPLDSLCREFLAARDSRNKQERERVELETSLAFDLILEVISSVYVLEPFKPSKVGSSVLVSTRPVGVM